MKLPNRGKWEAIENIGRGGQGQVYLACDTRDCQITLTDFDELRKFHETIAKFSKALSSKSGSDRFEDISLDAKLVSVIAKISSQIKFGALKILAEEGWSRDPEHAEQRFELELRVLLKTDHPNLIKLV